MRFILTLLCVLWPSLVVADQAAELVTLIPESSNTVAIVRLDAIWGTERAQVERWYERQQQRFASGAAVIPPWVDTLVVGSLVHPSVPEEVWSASVVRRPAAVTLQAIAEKEGSPVEQLGGVPAVLSHRDSYLLEPRADLLASFRPAQRLEAARWARALIANDTAEVSSYLTSAANQEGHVVLALDLRDLLDAARVEQILLQDERFVSQSQLVQRLIPLLVGLQGVTFAANIAQTNQATVHIDFSADVGPSSLTAKTLFVTALDDLGAAIDEFSQSQVTSSGRRVTLTCDLSDESLRRILSLIVTPSTPYQPATPTPQATTTPAPASPPVADPAKATTSYFAAVDKMIRDLQRANRRATNYERTAAWHDNFARKILELPSRDVTPSMLDYGRSIAAKFRALGASLRGQGVEVNTQQQTLTYDVDYTPGWASVNIWGGIGYGESAYNVSSNLREVRQRQAAAIADGADEREQIWLMIQNERDAIAQQFDIPSGR